MSLHNSTIIESLKKDFSKVVDLKGRQEPSQKDQAKKSARGMPWHQEPMKDVISCDKLRGAANRL